MNTKLSSRAKDIRKQIAAFRKEVWAYYRAHGRHDMPWRRDTSPYSIVVSEIMLQQTQASRVEIKFTSWMKRFPDWQSLAKASVKDVLQEWSGLGYNRRALYLKRIAEELVARAKQTGGKARPELPQTYEALRALPGIGPNTTGAILAYTFNQPHPFIETNIRSAYIHFFFPQAQSRNGSRSKIPDARLMPLIEAHLADPYIRTHAREWHWALMDYGSYIKGTHTNPSRRSAHHVKQSAFKGSNRELRANILKLILERSASAKAASALAAAIVKKFAAYPAAQVRKNLAALASEGFLAEKDGIYRIV